MIRRETHTTLKDLLLGFAILLFFLWFVWVIEQDRNDICPESPSAYEDLR